MGVFSGNFSNIFYLNAKSRPPGDRRTADNRCCLIDGTLDFLPKAVVTVKNKDRR